MGNNFVINILFILVLGAALYFFIDISNKRKRASKSTEVNHVTGPVRHSKKNILLLIFIFTLVIARIIFDKDNFLLTIIIISSLLFSASLPYLEKHFAKK